MNLRHLKTKAITVVTLHSPVEHAIKSKLRLKLYSPKELTLRMVKFDKIQKEQPGGTICAKYFSLREHGIDGCDDEDCDQCLFGHDHHRELLILKNMIKNDLKEENDLY